MKICHMITARAASQKSRGKRSILSAKRHKIATKDRYPNSHVQAAPWASTLSQANWPPQTLLNIIQSGGPCDPRRNTTYCSPTVHSTLRINYHISILVYLDFLNGCPLHAGNSTPNCDLQISLGKTRNVSTNLFMLRELLSDDSKLHPAKHVE